MARKFEVTFRLNRETEFQTVISDYMKFDKDRFYFNDGENDIDVDIWDMKKYIEFETAAK